MQQPHAQCASLCSYAYLHRRNAGFNAFIVRGMVEFMDGYSAPPTQAQRIERTWSCDQFPVLSLTAGVRELTLKISHAYVTILAQCGMLAGFIKTMQAEEMRNYKTISIFCRVKPTNGEKKKNSISKNHLSTVYMKSSEKIKCAISAIQWQTKIINMWPNRTSFQVGWSRLTHDVGTIQARYHLRAISLFVDCETLHFWSVVRKVPVWS